MKLISELEDGKYTIDLLGSDESGVYDNIGGDGVDEGLATTTGTDLTIDVTAAGDQYFVVTYQSGQAGESYLLEVSDTDAEDGVDIKNVITGDLVAEGVDNGSDSFSVGSATITMVNFVEDSWVNISSGSSTFFDRIITEEGLLIYLPVDGVDINLSASPTTYELLMVEEDKDANIAGGSLINVTLGHTTDYEVKVDSVVKSVLAGGDYFEIGDTDEFVGYVESDLGTRILFDKGPDQQTFKLLYPGAQSYGNVYVAETETSFTTAAGGTQKVLKKVSIPLAMSDSDALAADSSMNKKNYLLVGGPCANSASAKVLGQGTSWPDCGAGFEEGVGRIVLKESNGKVAMVVAGMTALDTTRATRVLKNYKDYTLSGDEVEVLGTSSTPQTVRTVSS